MLSRLLLLLLLAVQVAVAEPLPKELQGRWRASGQLPAPAGQHSMSWMLEYIFQPDGHYKMSGYPPITESGVLKVTAHQGQDYTLKFSDRTFMNERSQDIVYPAKLSADGKTLEFHDKAFIRQKKETR